MFLRPSLIKTMIVKNKKGRRILSKTLSEVEIENLVKKTYNEIKKGKTIDLLFQELALAKNNKELYITYLLKYFLQNDLSNCIIPKESCISFLTYLAKLDTIYNFGFVYVLHINNKIKIGKTKNIKSRLLNYKSHTGTMPVMVYLIFDLNYSQIEKELIGICSNYQITKEWVTVDCMDIITKYIDTFKIRQ